MHKLLLFVHEICRPWQLRRFSHGEAYSFASTERTRLYMPVDDPIKAHDGRLGIHLTCRRDIAQSFQLSEALNC
jgi:hypothetical protein